MQKKRTMQIDVLLIQCLMRLSPHTVSAAHLGSVSAGFTALVSGISHPLASIQLGKWGLASEASRMLDNLESSANGLSGRFRARNRFVDAEARIWRQCAPLHCLKGAVTCSTVVKLYMSNYTSAIALCNGHEAAHSEVIPQ